VEIREPKTFTKSLTDEQRNAARARVAQADREAKEAKRRASKRLRNLARKAKKAANKAIARAKPAPKQARPVALNPEVAYRPGMGVDFYRTREWMRLRYQALDKHGATCQCCGATRAQGEQMHVDHIKPRSIYPALELVLDNLQVLCRPCNLGKSNTSETDWR